MLISSFICVCVHIRVFCAFFLSLDNDYPKIWVFGFLVLVFLFKYWAFWVYILYMWKLGEFPIILSFSKKKFSFFFQFFVRWGILKTHKKPGIRTSSTHHGLHRLRRSNLSCALSFIYIKHFHVTARFEWKKIICWL